MTIQARLIIFLFQRMISTFPFSLTTSLNINTWLLCYLAMQPFKDVSLLYWSFPQLHLSLSLAIYCQSLKPRPVQISQPLLWSSGKTLSRRHIYNVLYNVYVRDTTCPCYTSKQYFVTAFHKVVNTLFHYFIHKTLLTFLHTCCIELI